MIIKIEVIILIRKQSSTRASDIQARRQKKIKTIKIRLGSCSSRTTSRPTDRGEGAGKREAVVVAEGSTRGLDERGDTNSSPAVVRW